MSSPSRATSARPEEIPPERIAIVDGARKSWIKKLIDLSRRNNLLFYRQLKTGTLDLSVANEEKMAELLSGQSVAVSKLLESGWKSEINDVVREIGRRALTNLEERGLSTLFVCLGMATWEVQAWPADSGRPVEAPVLMLPVKLETSGGYQSFALVRTGSVQVNLVLLHVLESQFGVRVSGDDLIPHLLGDDEGEPFDPQPLYQELIRRCSDVPGFDVRACAVLGNFAFQKMAMVKDLQERGAEMARHDVIAAIAGDKNARETVAASQKDPNPRDLDLVSPDNEFLILDADSSQQCAIAGVMSGQSAVVHGPPGTGKSQTIANLIASGAAAGKRILFVAEKRAALEVVLRRLQDCGLAHLTIDLHGADVSPRKVMEQVGRTLDGIRNSTPADGNHVHQQLSDRRTRLNLHDSRMHELHGPCGKSVYQLQGALLRLEHDAKCAARWRGADLQKITPQVAQKIRDLLTEASGLASLFLRSDTSPWTGAKLDSGATVQRALDLVETINQTSLPKLQHSLDVVVATTGARLQGSLVEVNELFNAVNGVQETLKTYSGSVFENDLGTLIAALGPGQAGGVRAAWQLLTNGEYRQARKTALQWRLKGKTSTSQLFGELVAVSDQRRKWSQWSDKTPVQVESWFEHSANLQTLISEIGELEKLLGRDLSRISLEALTSTIDALRSDSHTPHQLPKLSDIESKLTEAGSGPLVDEFRKKGRPVGTWTKAFDYAWFASSLDDVCQKDPEIRGFRGITHSEFVEQFKQCDEERIEIAAARVRRAHAELAVSAMNKFPDQQFLIRAEAQKSRRHLPLRKLFAQAADVLTAVCPCWMASPLSVSQLLDGGRRYFDLVIFDEASQVLPEDAVPSVLRGEKLVVAGDSHQLPPTTFFAAGDDEYLEAQEEPQATEGYESLLDMMNSFLRSWYLEWHYRSRDEALISFSNHHIYQDRLVTFPGPGGPPVVSHVLVQQELGADGQEESCAAEVRKVVELILDHARKKPDETLGVIAMGIKHADRLQRALDNAIGQSAEFGDFFDTNKPERFFIKNLERVQGDERDSIVLSIGYGKDRAGNLPFRFGPLLSAGGRRRLNVAVTRARQRLTLVSSFSHLDMDLSKVRAGSGVELLRNYLQYAATGGKRLGDAQITGFPVNSFEAEVCDVLSAKGMKLIPQMGASTYRIDLVAEHPTKPGRYVLAIECDGATYHSSYTARDRDRLRQQQLERLGWRFHRIWSTDWFTHKEEEVHRAAGAFEEAVKFADRIDAGVVTNGNGTDRPHRANGDSTAKARGPRPPVPIRTSITEYRLGELVSLVRWVQSDGQLRTDDQMITELVPLLGFARRGARIDAALRKAIAQANATQRS